MRDYFPPMTPEEQAFAREYEADAMADSAPDTTPNMHYGSGHAAHPKACPERRRVPTRKFPRRLDMELTLQQKLECPFPAQAVSWRIGRKSKDGTSAVLLAYIDARDVMERLEHACGFGNWQCRYSLAVDGLLICDIGIRIAGEWIWRANGAGDTQVEAEKGKCSDAFKRAAVLWGIGRYLYGLPSPRVKIDQYGKWEKDPELPAFATVRGYMDSLKTPRAA